MNIHQNAANEAKEVNNSGFLASGCGLRFFCKLSKTGNLGLASEARSQKFLCEAASISIGVHSSRLVPGSVLSKLQCLKKSGSSNDAIVVATI